MRSTATGASSSSFGEDRGPKYRTPGRFTRHHRPVQRARTKACGCARNSETSGRLDSGGAPWSPAQTPSSSDCARARHHRRPGQTDPALRLSGRNRPGQLTVKFDAAARRRMTRPIDAVATRVGAPAARRVVAVLLSNRDHGIPRYARQLSRQDQRFGQVFGEDGHVPGRVMRHMWSVLDQRDEAGEPQCPRRTVGIAATEPTGADPIHRSRDRARGALYVPQQGYRRTSPRLLDHVPLAHDLFHECPTKCDSDRLTRSRCQLSKSRPQQ